MKYFKIGNKIYAFEEDGSQDFLIKPGMIPLTLQEIDKIENPEKYLSVEEKEILYRESLPDLTKRQFKLMLMKEGLFDTIDAKIDSVKDPIKRTTLQIEYNESVTFERNSITVFLLAELLELDDDKLNYIWEKGFTL